jgi:hypothetical protein
MNQKLTAAEIGAVNDQMKIKFKQVIERQDHTNGCIKEHEIRLKEVENGNMGSWIKKHWKATVIIGLISLYLIYSLFELYSLKDIINAIKTVT